MDLPNVVNEALRWLPLLAGFRVTVHKPVNPGAADAQRWLKQAEEAYGPESSKIVPFLYELEERILNGPGNPTYRSVLPLVDRAFNIQRKHAGPESLELAEALAKLGECAAFLRHTDRAEAYLNQALAIRRNQLGEDHPLTGQVWAFLAMAIIIESQPMVQPEMLIIALNSHPLPVPQLPPPAQEAAGKALNAYNLRLKDPIYVVQATAEEFNYYAMRLNFRVWEQMNGGFTETLKSLSNTSRGSGGGGCFVATAVYGGADDPAVATLRRFRDACLMSHLAGRALVRVYYLIGPFLAGKVAGRPWRIRWCKRILDGIVAYINRRY